MSDEKETQFRFVITVMAKNRDQAAEEVLAACGRHSKATILNYIEEIESDERIVKISDSLNSRIETAQEEVLEAVREHLLENTDVSDDDEVYQEVADTFSEIADSNTPIYYNEIDGIYYLHGDELEESYRNAGIGEGDEENHRQVTIYTHISDACYSYYSDELKGRIDAFIEWRDGQVFASDEVMKNDIQKYIEEHFTEV